MNVLIKATGQILENGDTSISLSSIFTFLIKESARCNYFSSDILYEIDWLKESVNDNLPHTRIFAFRHCGIDSFAENELTEVSQNADYFKIVKIEIIPEKRALTVRLVNIFDNRNSTIIR